MLRPSMSQILKPGESYYEFVVAVARKAREIADQAIKDKICLEDKSVTLSDLKMHIGRQGEAEDQGDAPEAEPAPEEPEEDDDLDDPEEDELA